MTTAEQLKEMIEKNRPRPFDLSSHDELQRLYRECWGYLQTCHHKHGTDWEGRRYAMEALDALSKKKPTHEGWKLCPLPGAVVSSSHPRTVYNPDEYFEIKSVRFETGKVYARGEKTVWFNIDMLTPKTIAPVDGEQAPAKSEEQK